MAISQWICGVNQPFTRHHLIRDDHAKGSACANCGLFVSDELVNTYGLLRAPAEAEKLDFRSPEHKAALEAARLEAKTHPLTARRQPSGVASESPEVIRARKRAEAYDKAHSRINRGGADAQLRADIEFLKSEIAELRKVLSVAGKKE